MDGWIDDDITPLPFALQQGTGCSLSGQELGSLCFCHWNSLVIYPLSRHFIRGELHSWRSWGLGECSWLKGTAGTPRSAPKRRRADSAAPADLRTALSASEAVSLLPGHTWAPPSHTHTHQGHRHRYSQPICSLRNISGPFSKALSEARLKALLSQDKRVCFCRRSAEAINIGASVTEQIRPALFQLSMKNLASPKISNNTNHMVF